MVQVVEYEQSMLDVIARPKTAVVDASPLSLPKTATRGAILALEQALRDAGAGGPEDFPVTHYFAPKIYGRKMDIKAGSLIVGKIHKHAHLNIIISGRILVATEFGKTELHGGDVFISEPGTKRAVLALEDTVWLCTHPNETDTQDLEAIENYVIAPTYDALGMSQPELIEVT